MTVDDSNHGGRTVWLASYPKSGNTWFRAVHSAFTTRSGRAGSVDPNRLSTDVIASARFRLDGALGIVSSLLRPDELDALRPVADVELDRSSGSHDTGPHLCKIHDAYRRLPLGGSIVAPTATRCVVYLVRDPRDVVVSLAHHDGSSHAVAVERLADGGATLSDRSQGIGRQVPQRLGTWSDHVRSWVDEAPFPVHVVRYEDALIDPVETFTTAFRFAGLARQHDDLAAAVDAASFDRLREAEQRTGFRERPATTSEFFRRGRAGDWPTVLEPDLARRVERDHAAVMARFGYL